MQNGWKIEELDGKWMANGKKMFYNQWTRMGHLINQVKKWITKWNAKWIPNWNDNWNGSQIGMTIIRQNNRRRVALLAPKWSGTARRHDRTVSHFRCVELSHTTNGTARENSTNFDREVGAISIAISSNFLAISGRKITKIQQILALGDGFLPSRFSVMGGIVSHELNKLPFF